MNGDSYIIMSFIINYVTGQGNYENFCNEINIMIEINLLCINFIVIFKSHFAVFFVYNL